MYFSTISILAALSTVPSALSAPSSNVTRRADGQNVHCGTTDDATLSDCRKLVEPDTWNAAYAGTSNTCQ